MFTVNRLLYLLFVSVLLVGTARASWLSDVTGVNIDLAKSVGGVPQALNATQQPSQVVKLPAVAPQAPVPIATPEQRQSLQRKVDLAVDTFKTENDSYQSYATASVFATIILALCAAVAGFMRKAVAAGVLSLVVVASTGVAKAFPMKDRASYYQTLYGEALTLQVETSLAGTMTVAEYNNYVTRLTTILLYASKLPGVGDAGPVADELIKTVAHKLQTSG